MTQSNYTKAEIASGLVRAGISRLAGAYPFHTRVLERFHLRADPMVGALGVGFRENRLELAFCPEFVLNISSAELGGVLLHEVLHVVLGHVTADPIAFPDTNARRIAEEVTVNEFVREPLPGQPIILATFPQLPPNESTAVRYRRLAAASDPSEVSGTNEGPNGDHVSISHTGEDVSSHDCPEGNDGWLPESANETTVPGVGQEKTHPHPGKPKPGLVDNHDSWPTSPAHREQFRAGLVDMMTEIVAADIEVPPEIAEALRGCGVVPGQGSYQLRGGSSGHLNWCRLLQRYVGRVMRIEPRYGRPPRRFPELAGVVPRRAWAESETSVVAVVDTSASMSARLLERIAGELRRLGRSYKVHIVECDCVVRRSYRFRRRLDRVKGRGGTDFRPPLASEFLRPLRPGVVVVFTDGRGPAPDCPPPVPVVWCLTSSGQSPADWGQVVEMGSSASDLSMQGDQPASLSG